LADPSEGTILTVMRDAASITPAPSIEETLERMQKAALVSLRNTPNLLPLLKESGVIDAGGLGFYYLLEAFHEASLGKHLQENPSLQGLLDEEKEETGDLAYRYCVEGLLKKSEAYEGADKANFLKHQLEDLGGSVVFVETPSLVKFHVHANEDQPVKDAAIRYGTLLDYKVDNMARQVHNERFHQEKIGFVAVIDSDAFAAIYSNFEVPEAFVTPLGYEVSYEELSQAVDSLDCEEIIVLPNNKNAIPTCELLSKRSKKKVSFVPTDSEMAGVVALEHFDSECSGKENAKTMEDALEKTDFFVIVQAVKDYVKGSLNVKMGDFLLMKDGLLLAASKEAAGLLPTLLSLLDEKSEFTIYSGLTASDEEANFLAEEMRKQIPSSGDVVLVRGDQKIARYLISGEKA
jgi:dihydroxyacetone kinase-like predicted kinase